MVVAMPFVCYQRHILLQFTAIHGVVDLLHLWFLKTVLRDRPVNVHHQDHLVHQGNKSSSMEKGFYYYIIITFPILPMQSVPFATKVASLNSVHGKV